MINVKELAVLYALALIRREGISYEGANKLAIEAAKHMIKLLEEDIDDGHRTPNAKS